MAPFYDLKKGGSIIKKLRIRQRTSGDTDVERSPRIQKIQGKHLTWIDLQNPNREYMEGLAKEYGLNELNIEDCLTKFEIPKLDSYDDHFFVILHFPPVARKVGISKNSQISMFVGESFLITVHQGELTALTDFVRKTMQGGSGSGNGGDDSSSGNGGNSGSNVGSGGGRGNSGSVGGSDDSNSGNGGNSDSIGGSDGSGGGRGNSGSDGSGGGRGNSGSDSGGNGSSDYSDSGRASPPIDGPTSILLHAIIDELVDDLMHTSRRIIANLDDLEDMVFDERRAVARNIALLRREINRLRRIAGPLKKFVQEIARNVQKFASADGGKIVLLYDDIIDHIDKVIETLEESRETMEIYKDTDFVLSTEKTNKVLGMLTIIFTLAIPATIIGTFYGMNVNLPGGGGVEGGVGIGTSGDDQTGLPFGPFTMFVVLISASVASALCMFAYFKRNGWLSH